MVENEELDANFFGGSALQYLRELNAAVDVAHAHGVRVTDGGITTVALSLLTWGDLHDRGLDAQADDFATRAFARPDQAWLRADLLRKPFTGLGRAAVQAKWDQGKVLVQGLKVTGVDVVDLHWYGNDPSVLRQAIDYLKAATAKPVISTEMGQYDQRPDVVQSSLSVVTQERLPYVIWFDADGDPAVALHDPDGTLSPQRRRLRRLRPGLAPGGLSSPGRGRTHVSPSAGRRGGWLVELEGIEPSSVKRLTTVATTIPESGPSWLAHRPGSVAPSGATTGSFPGVSGLSRRQRSLPAVLHHFCCRAVVDRPRVPLLVAMSLLA